MNKYIAFLLCLMMILSLFACDTTDKNKDTENDTANTESLEKDDGTKDTSISDINKQYYKIEEIELTKVRYYIYDSDGNVVLSDETDRPLDISMLGDNIVDICIGMGSGISIHKYYDVQSNRFSEEYTYVAATSGNLVAYIDTSMEDPMTNRVLVVRDIFDKNTFYKSFGLDFSPTVHDPIESASFTDGEAELEVVYLSERYPISLSITLPVRSSSTGGEHLSENEIAMQMYEAFLKNEIPSESGYLKNHREEYLMDYLWERNGGVSYAYVDMDGDGQVELLVSGIDTFVFSYYHDRNVISIATTYNFREMNRVYVDGSYSWNYPSSDGVSYGLKKDGKDIWRIENEGGSYTLYYIGEESVTQAEMLKYLEENPSPEKVTFTNISGEGWNNVIGEERAEEIASDYWKINDGDINEQTGNEYRIYVSGESAERYYVRLRCQKHYYDPDIDSLYIDAITGAIILSDGKG
jgi:hypothetical protein